MAERRAGCLGRTLGAVALAVVVLALLTWAAMAQEQKVLWRQIKIGTYTVTWPASQGAANTCLQNDGSGLMSWSTCGTGPWTSAGGVIGQTVVSEQVAIGGGETASELRFLEPSGGGSSYVAFKAPALAANTVYTWPTADGTSGYVLQTNGSGALSWVAASAASHPDPHRLGSGSVSAPSYSFSAATSTGLYYGTSEILTAVGGVKLFGHKSQVFSLYNPFAGATRVNYIGSYDSSATPAVASLAILAKNVTLYRGEGSSVPIGLTFRYDGNTQSAGPYIGGYGTIDYPNDYSLVLSPSYNAGLAAGNYPNHVRLIDNGTDLKLVLQRAGASTSTGNFNRIDSLHRDGVVAGLRGVASFFSFHNGTTELAKISQASSNTILNVAGGAPEIQVNGTKVVAARGAAVTSPSADVNSLKTAVDALRTRLSDHGLIAP